MPRIFGLVASARRLGNCEVLAKEALLAAADSGAEVEIAYLDQHKVLPCNGCMACVFRGGCPLDDEAVALFDRILAADAFLLAAPTYFLGPASPVKTLMDRSLMVIERVGGLRPRPVATIATAGLSGWEPLSLPMLNQLALAMAGTLVGSFVAYAPGPAQSLLDPDNVTRARSIGQRLISGEPEPAPPGSCPVCRSTAFSIRGDGVVECPICLVTGQLKPAPDGHNGGASVNTGGLSVEFDPESVAWHRFTPAHLKEHFLGWIKPTKDSFRRDLPAIREARAKYKNLGFDDR